MLIQSIPVNNAVNRLNSVISVLVQVWDDMIIQSALKTFYDSDLSIMIQAIQRNITVSFIFLIFLMHLFK